LPAIGIDSGSVAESGSEFDFAAVAAFGSDSAAVPGSGSDFESALVSALVSGFGFDSAAVAGTDFGSAAAVGFDIEVVGVPVLGNPVDPVSHFEPTAAVVADGSETVAILHPQDVPDKVATSIVLVLAVDSGSVPKRVSTHFPGNRLPISMRYQSLPHTG